LIEEYAKSGLRRVWNKPRNEPAIADAPENAKIIKNVKSLGCGASAVASKDDKTHKGGNFWIVNSQNRGSHGILEIIQGTQKWSGAAPILRNKDTKSTDADNSFKVPEDRAVTTASKIISDPMA